MSIFFPEHGINLNIKHAFVCFQIWGIHWHTQFGDKTWVNPRWPPLWGRIYQNIHMLLTKNERNIDKTYFSMSPDMGNPFHHSFWWWIVVKSKIITITWGNVYFNAHILYTLHVLGMGNLLQYWVWWWSQYIYLSHISISIALCYRVYVILFFSTFEAASFLW